MKLKLTISKKFLYEAIEELEKRPENVVYMGTVIGYTDDYFPIPISLELIKNVDEDGKHKYLSRIACSSIGKYSYYLYSTYEYIQSHHDTYLDEVIESLNTYQSNILEWFEGKYDELEVEVIDNEF